jgi:chromosome segregation ATPase
MHTNPHHTFSGGYRQFYHEDTKSRRQAKGLPLFLRASVVTQKLLLGSFVLILALAAAPSPALRAADAPNTEEDRLRAALREMTLQLRTAQSDLGNLQTTQAALAEEKKVLSEKYETLKKQAVADKAATDKTMADLQLQTAAQKAQLARVNEALEKSKAEGASAAQAHLAAETQNVHLTAEYYALQRKIAELESKNLALFLVGNEILTRYEEFSLGSAISAKEPFVGKTRARLENLVQSYQDKLLDQRAKQ